MKAGHVPGIPSCLPEQPNPGVFRPVHDHPRDGMPWAASSLPDSFLGLPSRAVGVPWYSIPHRLQAVFHPVPGSVVLYPVPPALHVPLSRAAVPRRACVPWDIPTVFHPSFGDVGLYPVPTSVRSPLSHGGDFPLPGSCIPRCCCGVLSSMRHHVLSINSTGRVLTVLQGVLRTGGIVAWFAPHRATEGVSGGLQTVIWCAPHHRRSVHGADTKKGGGVFALHRLSVLD